MQTTIARLGVLAVLLGGLLTGPAAAQEMVAYTILQESDIRVEGTSNKSDWTVYTEEVSGVVTMDAAASLPDPGITQVRLVVAAGEMRSRRSIIMDRLMFDALKVDEHPEIVYELTRVEPAATGSNGVLMLNTYGRLTIAGVTNEITVPVEVTAVEGGRIRFKGAHALKMTDYKVRPPTAMFGALHTGDEVEVQFNLVAARGQ